MAMITYRGGCHCGLIKYEVLAPSKIKVNQCNCSICSKLGYLGLIVRKERFKLLCGAQHLVTYTFNTGTAKHLFCARCGIKSFYIPRSHPDGYNVNARCLDSAIIESMEINPVDGQNWEKRYPKGRAESYPD